MYIPTEKHFLCCLNIAAAHNQVGNAPAPTFIPGTHFLGLTDQAHFLLPAALAEIFTKMHQHDT